ncbi:MAG: response regulator [Candidatus Cyclobacteriaceae bacterium M3_2C_046]
MPGFIFGNDQIDSLKVVIAQNPPLPQKVDAMYLLAELYYYQDKDESKKLAQNIHALSASAGYDKGIWKSHNISAYLKYLDGQYDSAIADFTRALAISNTKEFVEEQIFSHYWLASSYIQKSDYEKAEGEYYKSLKLAIFTENQKAIAKAYMGLGILNYQQSRYEDALYLYLKADSVYGDKVSMNHGDVLQNIAITYHVLDQKVSEEEYLNQALDIYTAIDDQYGISHVYLRLGNIAKENHQFKKGLAYFKAAIPYFRETKNYTKLAEVYLYLGKISLEQEKFQIALDYFNQATENENIEKLIEANILLGKGIALVNLGQKQEAIQFITQADRFSEELTSLDFKGQIYRGYAAYYKLVGDAAMVYQMMSKANQIVDSLARIKSSKTLHEMEAKYQNAKKQQEIELLATQNALSKQQKSKQFIVFLAITLSLLVILVGLFYSFQLKQKANRKLKEADLLKSSFLTNISHEFRTPLHLISGPVEYRLKDHRLPLVYKEELEMIQRNSKNLLNLVDQLLDLSKLESGVIKLRADRIYLNTTLKSLASSFEFMARQKQINYQLQFPDKEVLIDTHPDALHKIVMNLLGNAFKYTPISGIIQFSVKMISGQLMVEVKNSGSGIEPAKLKQIFNRFYQSDPQVDGLGVGLALVKELAERMNGKITASSAPGDWTTFMLTLPVKEVPEQVYAGENDRPNPVIAPELTGQMTQEDRQTLLIVDDHADTRHLMRNLFAEDYHLIIAENGQTGWELAKENIPDIIISDLMMPVMNGLDLCKQIKSHELTSHIPVILLTAKAGDENALQGLDHGADDYLVKPFNQDLLKAKTRNLISLREKLQERYAREIILKPKDVEVTSREEQFLEKVRQILDNFLTDGNFNARQFSEEMGMSRMQLHRKLKALTGFTANELILTHRLDMAARLLKSNHATVAEICYLAGFNDPSYFSKCFKDKFHVSPSDYLKVKSLKPK